MLLGELGQLTDENASPGTLDYMAPEQRYRLDVTEQADQFALAVVAYEMLTGSLPPRTQHSASSRNPRLNKSVDAVLERAMQEDPEKRFSNVSTFVEKLLAELDQLLPARKTAATLPRTFQNYALPATLTLVCIGLLYLEITRDDPTANPRVADPSIIAAEGDASTAQPVMQTGALPYRMNSDGEIEVLIVQARTRSHWTIPKANQYEEDSQQKVAEEEAYEEAGIHGSALHLVLGTYEYRRKGRQYQVAVVPVQAREDLLTWPEQFRDRKWCRVSDAARMIASDELRQIVMSFSVEKVASATDRSRQ